MLSEMPKAVVKPTRGAVTAAVTSRMQSSNDSQDHSIRRSAGSGKLEKMRKAAVSIPNLSQ